MVSTTQGSYASSTLSNIVAISLSLKGSDQKPVTKEEFIRGLKDEIEIDGVERDAAIASPLKGKKRLMSTACFNISISTMHP